MDTLPDPQDVAATASPSDDHPGPPRPSTFTLNYFVIDEDQGCDPQDLLGSGNDPEINKNKDSLQEEEEDEEEEIEGHGAFGEDEYVYIQVQASLSRPFYNQLV